MMISYGPFESLVIIVLIVIAVGAVWAGKKRTQRKIIQEFANIEARTMDRKTDQTSGTMPATKDKIPLKYVGGAVGAIIGVIFVYSQIPNYPMQDILSFFGSSLMVGAIIGGFIGLALGSIFDKS